MSPRARRAVGCAGVALLAAAIVTELRKPPAEREWHGRIAGIVPYELRPPTLQRVRERVWNPVDERIFTDHVFGVGWSVNLGRIARLLLG